MYSGGVARPTIAERVRYLTATRVAQELGINVDTLVRRIGAGEYPPPTAVNDQGVRFFSTEWLRRARPKRPLIG